MRASCCFRRIRIPARSLAAVADDRKKPGLVEEWQIVKFPAAMRTEAVWLRWLSLVVVAASDFRFPGPSPITWDMLHHIGVEAIASVATNGVASAASDFRFETVLLRWI
uniref:Uncharacterized protein n=1 Tax=Oryza brachyantha TaxID=4533 RepID=J3MGA7_ORYBR